MRHVEAQPGQIPPLCRTASPASARCPRPPPSWPTRRRRARPSGRRVAPTGTGRLAAARRSRSHGRRAAPRPARAPAPAGRAGARCASRGVLRAARGGPGVPWSRVRSARSSSCCARRPAAARRRPPCSRPAATARCSWVAAQVDRAARHPVPPATGTSHPAARARRRPRRCGNHGARPAPAPRRRWPLPGSFPWDCAAWC